MPIDLKVDITKITESPLYNSECTVTYVFAFLIVIRASDFPPLHEWVGVSEGETSQRDFKILRLCYVLKLVDVRTN